MKRDWIYLCEIKDVMKDFGGQRSRKRETQQTKKKGEGGRNLLLRSLLLGLKSRIMII